MTAADASIAPPGPDWLQRDRHVIDGLDQLGIQVVSINIYSSLLPGITNVTDRARYYSLYPWILHRYASRGASDSSKVEWLTWVRRIDYAYALASALAEKVRSDAGTAVVGINTARRLLRNKSDDDVIDLEPQTEVDDKGKARASAYFKNGEGGLGQYYKGAMRLLGISLESSKYRYPDWAITDYAGRLLAESLDGEPGFSGLLEIAQVGRATVRALREAGAKTHPASIPQGSEEQRILRDLFLATDEAACAGQAQDTQYWRRSSLRLMLDFVSAAKGGVSNLPEEFRWGAHERRNAAGQSWEVSTALEPALSAWSGYQRNDLMNDGRLIAIRSESHKCLRVGPDDVHCFDLVENPGEQSPLASNAPEVQSLRMELAAFAARVDSVGVASGVGEPEPSQEQIPEEVRVKLEALGCVDGGR